ncbi:Uncharacterised protein [Nocardia otitidiscaviarum]|uniref:DUF3093 domain-containing protein n=1 Tax=Nocardia otitidiscaviarum TaxID=1823 RepID=A0A378YAW2_9NOCA|nr:hypothetical protein [Nocardia otitidiscaviarum]SUA73680.1 Uncharacterised protein [Nocardia otitidiscaviarum]
MTDAPAAPAPPVLFAEPGARWRTIAYGPALCGLILVLEVVRGGAIHWFGLAFCAALLGGFVWLQVVAGRRHISVELTDTHLRQGTELLPLRNIAAVLPEVDEESWDDEDWQSARALGELTGVPRRRGGIGLKLRDGGLVQAWARDHRTLRAELTAALERLPELEDRDAVGRDIEERDEEKGAR